MVLKKYGKWFFWICGNPVFSCRHVMPHKRDAHATANVKNSAAFFLYWFRQRSSWWCRLSFRHILPFAWASLQIMNVVNLSSTVTLTATTVLSLSNENKAEHWSLAKSHYQQRRKKHKCTPRQILVDFAFTHSGLLSRQRWEPVDAHFDNETGFPAFDSACDPWGGDSCSLRCQWVVCSVPGST